jgi:transcriptional regulator with XRE-family HTH domain
MTLNERIFRIYRHRLLATVKHPPLSSFDLWDKVLVGQRVRAFRRAKGWSQTLFARMIGHGTSPQKLNNYERGRDQIPPHIAGKLCAVAGDIDFDYIYRGRMDKLPPKLAEKIIKILSDPPAQPRARRGLHRS